MRLRGLLAPGGTFYSSESTKHFAWLDMTIGLFEGWQHFADDLRSDNPLLPSETWIRVLKDCGFFDAHAFPRTGIACRAISVSISSLGVSPKLPASTVRIEAASAGVSAGCGSRIAANPKVSRFSDRIREAIPGERGRTHLRICPRAGRCRTQIGSRRSGPERSTDFWISDLIH